jgi:cytochrome c oxidase cbb3-type subunit 4
MELSMGDVRGVIAAITFITFLGICWWAYRGANRERFEQDAMMPFLDDDSAADLGARTAEGEDR